MISADRKTVVHNAYSPTPNIAEIKYFGLFACVLFPFVSMMVCMIVQRMWIEMNELKLLLKNRTIVK